MRMYLLRLPANVAAHPAGQFGQEGVYFAGLALQEALDPAVGQISHVAAHGVTIGDTAGGISETHTLDVTSEADDSLLLGHLPAPWTY